MSEAEGTVKLLYGNVECNSFSDLLQKFPDREFATLTRSTVPLLAFWSSDRNVEELARAMGLTSPPVRAAFEYSVPAGCSVCGGVGKASFTDVMMDWGNAETPETVVALEAKHTEPLSETVAEWLGSPVKPNREAVLKHWWHLVTADATAEPPRALAEEPIVYQMLHRTASACSRRSLRRTVVAHLLLGDDAKKTERYVAAVERLCALVGSTSELLVITADCRRHPGRQDFEQVLPIVEEERADQVRAALADGPPLFEFGEVRIRFPRPT